MKATQTQSVVSNHTPASGAIADARAILPSILALLDAFNHRHHNQHRRSHWWSTFSIFRCSIRRLAACLECGGSRLGNVTTQSSWLHSHIIPRAFITFSQLCADNQHAPLGLFLIAVLGRVHGLMSTLIPLKTTVAKAPLAVQVTPEAASPMAPCHTRTEQVDKGVVVSRNAEQGARDQFKGQNHPRKTTLDHAKDAGKEGKLKDKKQKRKKAKAKDALSSLFGSLG